MSAASRARQRARAERDGTPLVPKKARRRLVHVWPSAKPGQILKTASGLYKVDEKGAWRKLPPQADPVPTTNQEGKNNDC